MSGGTSRNVRMSIPTKVSATELGAAVKEALATIAADKKSRSLGAVKSRMSAVKSKVDTGRTMKGGKKTTGKK